MHVKPKLLVAVFLLSFFPCRTSLLIADEKNISVPVEQFYQYDKKVPLDAVEENVKENGDFTRYHIIYNSVHDKKVTAILTVPKKVAPPYPVIIYQHGMSESKDNEQIQFGTRMFVKEGYAVFSIDADYHGERKISDKKDFVVSMLGSAHIFRMRDMFIQTAVDIRRGIDFLSKKDFIDKKRIGYAGISMGGIIGVLVAAVDKRIKAPVFIVAGGNFLSMIPMLGIIPNAQNISAVFDPVNFIAKISPRPFLMLNGLQDASMEKGAKFLYEAGKNPKQIFWVKGTHVEVPFNEETIRHCLEFFAKNLK